MIRNKQTSRVAFMIGNTENDGSLFALNQNNLATYLASTFGTLVTANQVRALYPSGLSDNAVISELIRDFVFLWSVTNLLRTVPPNVLTAQRSSGAPPP
jgi:carboxylesterase type B